MLLDGPAVLAPSTATFNGLDRKYTMQAWTEGGCIDIPPQLHFLMCRRTTTRGDSDYSTSVLQHALQAAMLDLASELAVSATRLRNLIGIPVWACLEEEGSDCLLAVDVMISRPTSRRSPCSKATQMCQWSSELF